MQKLTDEQRLVRTGLQLLSLHGPEWLRGMPTWDPPTGQPCTGGCELAWRAWVYRMLSVAHAAVQAEAEMLGQIRLNNVRITMGEDYRRLGLPEVTFEATLSVAMQDWVPPRGWIEECPSTWLMDPSGIFRVWFMNVRNPQPWDPKPPHGADLGGDA